MGSAGRVCARRRRRTWPAADTVSAVPSAWFAPIRVREGQILERAGELLLLLLEIAPRRLRDKRVGQRHVGGRRERHLTLRQADRLSDGLAASLARDGIGPGDRVAFYLQNVPELPLTRGEPRAWTETPAAERDRLSKRNFYRILDRFRSRMDLAAPGA